MLEAVVRDHLNVSAPRTMAVLDPVKVTITNHAGDRVIQVPDFPNDPDKGSHNVQFSNPIYIDRSDYRSVDEKGYRRLSPGQAVGLRYAGVVLSLVEAVTKDGKVIELKVKATPVGEAEKPKAFIQWVANPVDVEVRMYDQTSKHKSPEDTNEVPGGFLTDINPDSLTVFKAKADKHIVHSKVYDRFQFERIGFFCVDKDSSAGKPVFNLTVGLKEDTGKI
jgi:glutaminyl-tRNA synthetase